MTRAPVVLLTLAAVLAAAAPASATFPGANGKLVFQRPAGDQLDVFTIGADGRGAKRILGAPVIEEQPVWSPDGRRIAFARSARGGHPTEIWTTGPGGEDLQQVTRYKDIAAAPSWTPDGRIVFFTTKDFPAPSSPDAPPPPAELYSITADGSDARRLTADRSIQTDPDVSPIDGTIAFAQWRAVAGRPGVHDIGLSAFRPDGSARRTLAPISAFRDAINPSWSPDGRRIVFELISATPRGNTGGSRRQSDIATMNADGSDVRRLTRTPALESVPVWSPDGDLIAFTSDRHKKRGKRERNSRDFELYVMRADGTAMRRITRNTVADMNPDWQALPR